MMGYFPIILGAALVAIGLIALIDRVVQSRREGGERPDGGESERSDD